MIPIIEEAALRAVITPQVAVDAMREAFRADGDGRAHVPAVINLDVPASIAVSSTSRPRSSTACRTSR